MVALLVVVMAGAAAARPAPKRTPGHLRCLTDASQRLVDRAAEQSPAIRQLIDDLERSDVVVYVELLAAPDDASFHASMRFVTFTGGTRFLLVQVDGLRTAGPDQVALFGHEMSHALEVASAPEVQSPATFSALYKRIGTEWGSHLFETANARATEQRVRQEVAGGSRAHAVGPRPLHGTAPRGPQ
jgi:hypothetical protein